MKDNINFPNHRKPSEKRRHSSPGFTIVEVIIAAMIIVVGLAGVVQVFYYARGQGEISANLTYALSAAQDKMEEIRNHTFSSIITDYSSGGTPGNTFALSEITGKGVITIDATDDAGNTEDDGVNSNLLQVEIVVSFKTSNSRIVGEDQDLDGVLDAGEDLNGNGKLDSPVTIVSRVAKR